MPTHPIKDLVYVTRVLRQELNYDFIFELVSIIDLYIIDLYLKCTDYLILFKFI